ncbi:MAG: hypothetical protein R3183_11385 [Oleiphilaceae bacterium]|nr:hypothetical protein [Oleiphilaceae bacterium]
MTTLEVKVTLPEQAAVIAAWFEGRNMEMGQHPLKQSDASVHMGEVLEGMIPVCSAGSSMSWQLTLKVEQDERTYSLIWPLGPQNKNEQ